MVSKYCWTNRSIDRSADWLAGWLTQQTPITHVAMIIVVEAEVAPILEELQFQEDEAATAALLGLARVRSGMYGSGGGSFRLSVLKVAESKIFHRHFSGYATRSPAFSPAAL